ncbi:hypothetical protein Tco_0850555 [Tanacetum coccineum]
MTLIMFTFKMESPAISPTIKQAHGSFLIKRTCKLGDSDVHTLEDPTLILEIMSRNILLKIDLPESQVAPVKREGDTSFHESVHNRSSYSTRISSMVHMKAQVNVSNYPATLVQDHNNYLDSVGNYHEVYEMQNDVQQNYVVDSNVEYTSDSNIIPYEQYVKNNTEQVVQSNVSSVPNDALMMIINDMQEQAAQCISANEQNKVVNESLTAELARYKEQVEIYEKDQGLN